MFAKGIQFGIENFSSGTVTCFVKMNLLYPRSHLRFPRKGLLWDSLLPKWLGQAQTCRHSHPELSRHRLLPHAFTRCCVSNPLYLTDLNLLLFHRLWFLPHRVFQHQLLKTLLSLNCVSSCS